MADQDKRRDTRSPGQKKVDDLSLKSDRGVNPDYTGDDEGFVGVEEARRNYANETDKPLGENVPPTTNVKDGKSAFQEVHGFSDEDVSDVRGEQVETGSTEPKKSGEQKEAEQPKASAPARGNANQ